MKRNIIIIVLIIGLINEVKAQQDAYYTSYNNNLSSINPAFSIGNEGALRMGFMDRAQWLGFEDAPNTAELFLHYAFTDISEGSITIQRDQLGKILNETTISLDYSHNIFINPYSYFSLGLKVSATMFNSNLEGLLLESGHYTTDPNFLKDPKKFFPNVGVGAFWYDEDYNYYLGLSVPNLFSSKYFNVEEDTYKYKLENPHVYFTGGTLFELENDITFRPSFLLRYANKNPFTIDVNGMFQFRDKFDIGLSYSLGVSASAFAAIKFNDNWKIGYTLGMPTNKLFSQQFGSHEFYILYDINFRGTRYRSTRSF